MLAEQLLQNPAIGKSIGGGFYKIRLAISSKSHGKSGGARDITNVKIVGNVIYLVTLYDKSEHESIKLSELKAILNSIS